MQQTWSDIERTGTLVARIFDGKDGYGPYKAFLGAAHVTGAMTKEAISCFRRRRTR